MNRKMIYLLVAILAAAGCAGSKSPDPAEGPENNGSPPKEAVLEKDAEAKASSASKTGSLFRSDRSSLFSANKASRPGDILTVTISEQASAEKDAGTSTSRSSSNSLGVSSIFGYEERLAEKYANLDPSSLLSTNTENSFDGSGSTSRQESLSATLTTRVTGIDEGGNLEIQGSKTVRVNHENQIIRLSGIVRPYDITENNTIDSENILDAKIEYLGDGVISEKQRPGWMVRVLDVIWPF